MSATAEAQIRHTTTPTPLCARHSLAEVHAAGALRCNNSMAGTLQSGGHARATIARLAYALRHPAKASIVTVAPALVFTVLKGTRMRSSPTLTVKRRRDPVPVHTTNPLHIRARRLQRTLTVGLLVALTVTAPARAYAATTNRAAPTGTTHRAHTSASTHKKLRLGAHAWWRRRWVLPTAGAVAFLAAMRIHEGNSHGPFGIDYRLKMQDKNGFFSRSNQLGLEFGTVAFEAAGALFLGNHPGLGHTFWQAADASVFAGAATQLLKFSFSRARPYQNRGPNAFFAGHGDQSFPSGEVTLQASFVTPFILHYRHRYPWIWAAELLPIYDAYGRMKSQGHWQSDVLAGWVLGTAFGYWASQRKIPLLVEILPKGLSVGFATRF